MTTPDDPRAFQPSPDDSDPGDSSPLSELTELRDPELQRLFNEPELRAAVEGGDPAELERTLQQRRRFEPDPNLCAKIDELLQNRRLFLRPIHSAPSLFTFNGIGTMLYGRQDFDPSDGTYFATLWFTVLFLPIVPLRQYLVADAGGGAYHFLGRVSVSRGPRRVAWTLAALVVAAVAAVAATSWYSSRYTEVHFLNGLDTAVAVELDNTVVEVPPEGRVTRRLANGAYNARVTDLEGAVLEEQTMNVSGGGGLVAYNVLGAAPLIVENVVYTGPQAVLPPQNAPEFDHFVGQRLVRRPNVDYVFEDPPAEISLPSERSVQRRRHAFVLPGGWQTSLNVLTSLDDMQGIASLTETIALARPDDITAVRLAWAFIETERGPDASAAFVEQLLERVPDNVEIHRVRQEAMARAGQETKAREIYRRMEADRPDSAMAAYLRARLEPLAESRDLYRDLVARFPDYYYAVNGYAYVLAMSRQFEKAVPLFEQARQMEPEEAVFSWDLYLASLVAAGQPDAAIAALVEACRQEPESVSLGTAILYGQLAQLRPDDSLPHPGDYYLSTLAAEPEETDFLRAWFDLHVSGEVDAALLERLDDETRQAIDLCLAAGRDPERALALAEATTPEILAGIDNTTLVLLACEAGRLGRHALARKLLDGAPMRRPEETEALVQFALEGVDSDRLAELDLAVQAALHLARARRAEAAGQPADVHLAGARADDVLRGVVARACDRWPPVRTAAVD